MIGITTQDNLKGDIMAHGELYTANFTTTLSDDTILMGGSVYRWIKTTKNSVVVLRKTRVSAENSSAEIIHCPLLQLDILFTKIPNQ